ncbi:hypothetical protein LTR50_004790 [Elasticomyces elasticus]|nr:hypothetical protein LTR50_004790 [Elasticomyces elasticus]
MRQVQPPVTELRARGTSRYLVQVCLHLTSLILYDHTCVLLARTELNRIDQNSKHQHRHLRTSRCLPLRVADSQRTDTRRLRHASSRRANGVPGFGCVDADTPVADTSIGERTIVGAGVCIYGITHALDWRERAADSGGARAAPVRIGDDVWIGDKAVILPGVTVGDAAVIAPFTVVMEDVPAYHHVCGNPARVLCKVASDVPSAKGLDYRADGIRVL